MRKLSLSYGRYGGVARLLFNTLEPSSTRGDWLASVRSYENELRRAVHAMLSDITPMGTPEELYLGKGSNKFVFIKPVDGKRVANDFELATATEYVGTVMANVVTALQDAERLAFYRRMNTVKWLNDAAGKVFEKLVHEYYERLGTFSLGRALEADDLLPEGTTFEISQAEVRELGGPEANTPQL